MIKSFDELEMERESLLDALDKCDPNDEAKMQELQDKLDIVEVELELKLDDF